MNNSQPRQSRGGDGAPPSRGSSGGGGSGGWKTIQTGLGPVQYQDAPGGGRRIRMAPDVRENFEEGARVSFSRLYNRDPAAALADYTNDHITMALENYTDESGSYMKRGDGLLLGRE